MEQIDCIPYGEEVQREGKKKACRQLKYNRYKREKPRCPMLPDFPERIFLSL
jgi:hypothetical protein